MLDGNATVEWTPPQYKKRMDDWLRNMGDWNISRKRYFGLPLPFYPCECGHLNVIGSRAELEERATRGLDQLQELHRPWIDEVTIRCEPCDRDGRAHPRGRRRLARRRHRPLLDARLAEPGVGREGNATGSARGLTGAPTSRPRVLGEVVPRRLGLGDARADPPLVLLPVLHGDHARRARSRTGASSRTRRSRRDTGARCTSRGGTRSSERGARADGRGRDALALLRPDAEPAAALRLRAGGRGRSASS